MTSDEDINVYCQPCFDDDTKLPAHGYCTDCNEHLCKNCFTVHKKHKLSKHHTLLDATSMPKSLQQPTTVIHTSQDDHLTTRCDKHPKEIIKFFCNNHKELLCSVCVTLEHAANPCDINYIPDISGDVIDSQEYQDVLQALQNISDIYKKIVEDVKKMTTKSNNSLKTVLSDIKKYREEINQRLDELERQAEDATKVAEEDNNQHMKLAEATCEDITKSLKTSSNKIKQLNTSKQADQLFVELKLAEQKVSEVEDITLQLTSYDVVEHNFKPNEAISTLLKKEKSLGSLADKESQPVKHKTKSRQALYQGEICVKTTKDKYKCWITGMALLTPDLLIIADRSNTTVKMVDTRSQAVTDQIQLNVRPQDITMVTNTETAVTLPDTETIQFISTLSKKLEKGGSIKVGGECWGITCYQGYLVVSFCDPTKLQILDMNGAILRNIDGSSIFKYPWLVRSTDTSIYVTDCEMRSVTRFNWQGDMTGCYGNTSMPYGIAVSDGGSIFVCDMIRDVIREIAGDCSTGKVVLKDLNHPSTVCFCADTKELYHSCYTEQDRYDNSIYIYKLS